MFELFNLQKLLKDDNLNSIVRIVVHRETTFDQLIQKFNKDSFKNLIENKQKKLQQLLCSSHHALLFSKNTEKLKLLLQSGVNPNNQYWNGSTALHWAVGFENKDIVELLFGHGANSNIQNNNEIKRSKLMKTLFIIIILMGTVALFQFFGKITLKTVFLELKKFLLKNPKTVVVPPIDLIIVW